jgi:hypothetical protein
MMGTPLSQRAANETVLAPETLEVSRRLNNLAKLIETMGIEPKS